MRFLCDIGKLCLCSFTLEGDVDCGVHVDAVSGITRTREQTVSKVLYERENAGRKCRNDC